MLRTGVDVSSPGEVQRLADRRATRRAINLARYRMYFSAALLTARGLLKSFTFRLARVVELISKAVFRIHQTDKVPMS